MSVARLFFCALPALIVAVALSFIHPGFGVVAFAFMFHLGLAVTEVRPERGERK